MSEPTNPLFEEEKAFLERKKLEYERALRGDVAQLKEQTAQVGRVAAVGAGLAGSIWLITKIFGGGKRRKKTEDEPEWPTDFDAGDYQGQRFADFDFADEDEDENEDARYTSRYWQDRDPYFGSDSPGAAAHGTVYHSDTDNYDTPSAPGPAAQAPDQEGNDQDDNGLGAYPDFPPHSAPQHGADDHADPHPAGDTFQSEAYGHPESSLAFDDSRRLPESKDFAKASAPAAKPKGQLGPMLVALAKSDIGKVVLGQAASLATALFTKALKSKLTSDAPETAKSSDLAAPTDSTDGYAHGHPATPQPDAQPAPADDPAHPEPLA